MDSRRLRYFVQIVDSGSITRAAALSGVAQPALSQQLAILENELKVKLLDRSVSGVTPTSAGRVLYARVFAAADAHLSQSATTVSGKLAAPSEAAFRRFGGLPTHSAAR